MSAIKEPRRSLFEIEAEFKMLADQLEQAAEDGIEPPDDAIAAVRLSLVKAEEKRDAFAGFIRRCEAYAKHCRAEAELHRKKAATAERTVAWLKSYALDVMTTLGCTRLEGLTAKFSVQDNSQPSLVMLDESAVPEKFWRVETTRTVDKDALASAIEAGEVDGSVAMLVRGKHLRIR